MTILKKKKIHPVILNKGDTISVSWNDVKVLDMAHKGKDKEINWVAIFEYKDGLCAGLFTKEPK